MGTIRLSCWGGKDNGSVVRPLGVITLTGTVITVDTLSAVIPAGTKVGIFHAVEDHFIGYNGTAVPSSVAGVQIGKFFLAAGKEREIRLDTDAAGTEKFSGTLP